MTCFIIDITMAQINSKFVTDAQIKQPQKTSVASVSSVVKNVLVKI